MEASGNRIDVGKVIGETFSIYGAHAGVLLGAAVIVFVIAGVIQGLLATSGSLILVLIGSAVVLVASTLYTGFVVTLVNDVRDGKRDFTVGEMFGSAAGVIGPLLINGILKAIAVTIGFILLVVPGLILLTIWAVTAPAIVVERAGGIDAFGRSRELVRGQGWPVFGVILIAFLITFAISLVAGAIGAATGDAGRVILSTIGSIIAAPISALVAAVLFFDLGGGRSAPATTPAEPAAPAGPTV
jgi:hypothetical protein